LAKNVDQILNDLEVMITSEASERNYSRLVLRQLRLLLAGEMVARVQAITATEWLVLSCDFSSEVTARGESPQTLQQQLCRACQQIDQQRPKPQSWSESEGLCIAVPIQDGTWQAGGIVLRLAAHSTLHETEVAPILAAGGELLMAHATRWKSQRWLEQASGLQAIIANIGASVSRQTLHFTLANDLRVYLKADRISVWRNRGKRKISLVALSDSASEPSETELPHRFRELALETCQSAKAVHKTETVNDNIQRNWLAFGWPRESSGESSDFLIVAYWDDESRYMEAIQRLRSSIVALEAITLKVDRYLALPYFGRRWSGMSRPWRSLGWRAIAWGLALLIVALLGLRPMPFAIDGKAMLEPKVQVNVFATYDGMVDEIAVTDGSEVAKDDKLIQIRSAELELELEESQGELLALEKKRDGFKISLNQLKDDPQSQIARSQLSAEVIELDQREKQLQQVIQLQQDKQQSLLLKSPVSGLVITDNLRELLDHRPVKRGDSLLQIADIHGEWHLKVEVPDREAGHIKREYEQDSNLKVRFRIASDPDQEYIGTIIRISESTRISASNDSVWVIYVAFDQSQVPLRFGSNVLVQFDCGIQPTWYVWLRPLWENMRRRFWL
jgi:hypothetical protein